MNEQNKCPHCGKELPPDAPRGVCPRCLMQAGLGEGPDAAAEELPVIEGPGTEIGHYELLELIGEGGMGLVYLAEQKEPIQRKVALKIVKLGMDTMQVVARFRTEQQTLAMLDHPNIARVLDAGMTETGRPYFVMEHVQGQSITKYCDEHKLCVQERLRLFKEVCEGVHHAHQKGIIHRDLKPSNILVSMHGERAVTKIIDFGVAKAVSEPLTGATHFTRQGQLLGTPEYMSPEQVDLNSADIDTRSDIYSLGVLLYELLAGVLPFDRASFERGGLTEIQRTIQEEEPTPPSTRLTGLGEKAKAIAERRRTQLIPLARCLHRELEWIPMKAMRKDRTRRYRSASELADDIENYLTGRPLIAGPESSVYRARKFMRKHAGSAITVALVGVALIVGVLASTAMAVRADQARTAAEEQTEEYRQLLYAHQIGLADASYREGNVGRAEELLAACPEDLRGWEWDRVNHVLDQSVMSFSPHVGQMWASALSPDGKRVACAGSGTIKVLDLATGEESTSIADAHAGVILHVEFSPDGKRIASCVKWGEIKVWDTADVNKPITSIIHSSYVPRVSFSPDGRQIVSLSPMDGTIKIWDATTGTEQLVLNGPKGWEGGVWFAAFSPNGQDVISAGRDGTITIWDAVSGDEKISFKGHGDAIATVSFNSDGSLFASGSNDNTIKIWNATTGSLLETLYGHEGPINAVAFSPDDKTIISGSSDSTVRIWDTATAAELRTLRGHEGRVTSVAFTPDGRQAVSGSEDGVIKAWDVNVDRDIKRLLGHGSQVLSIAFSPDGKRLVSRSRVGNIKVWDVIHCGEIMTLSEERLTSSEEMSTFEGSYTVYCQVSFSPDGKQIALNRSVGGIVIRNAETGHEITTLGNREDDVSTLAFSPDGKRIVSGSFDGKVKLWDVETGEEMRTLREGESEISSVAFSPDGTQILSGQRDGEVKLWDVASGAERMSLIGNGRVIDVTFSPDGKRIASSCMSTVRIWDAATGKELKTLRGHGDIFIGIAFSPDGRRLVTSSRDGTAKIWDSSSGYELLTLHAADSGVTDVAFSPDGKSIAGGTFGKSVVLWESAAPADD